VHFTVYMYVIQLTNMCFNHGVFMKGTCKRDKLMHLIICLIIESIGCSKLHVELFMLFILKLHVYILILHECIDET